MTRAQNRRGTLALRRAGMKHVKAKPQPPKDDPMSDVLSDTTYRVTADELRSFVEREERLAAERKNSSEDSKELFAEAKGRGYDPAVIKACIKLRAADPDKVSEFEAALDLYKEALGMQG